MILYYFAIKIAFFVGLLRAFVKSDALQKHTLFLGLLYTFGLAFLSYAFVIAPQNPVVWTRGLELRLAVRLLPRNQTTFALLGWRAWQIWLAENLFLMTLYLRLLARFDGGGMFWLILVLGLALIPF